MKKFSIGIIVMFILAGVMQAQTTPEEAAEAGLPLFLQKIPDPIRHLYGFQPEDDLNEAVLGKAIPLYTIRPQRILQDDTSTPVSSLIEPTGMWYFPVLLDNQMRAILVVDKMGNQWQAVSFGYVPLARQLNKIWAIWPQENGFEPKLIHVFQAEKFLFHIPQINKINLTEIHITPPDLGKTLEKNRSPDYSKLGSADHILKKLKPLIRQNLNQ